MQPNLIWSDPEFLAQPKHYWPSLTNITNQDNVEKDFCGITSSDPIPKKSLLNQCLEESENFIELTRVIGISHRFFTLTKNSHPTVGPLTPNEILRAEETVIRWKQELLLSDVLGAVRDDTRFRNSKFPHIRQLCPFINEQGLLRVGGRIQNATIPFDARHPILVPKGKLALSIAKHKHLRLQDPGPQEFSS